MKVALVTLSGTTEAAHSQIESRWPEAKIFDLPRTALQNGSFAERLKGLRSLRPDVFAVMTESLDWQFGKEALMFFGAAAGAQVSTIIDARGRSLTYTRLRLLARSHLHIISSYVRGRRAISEAARRISNLESLSRPREKSASKGSPRIAYLRTTPAAGTIPGGAASHIQGVVHGLNDLGADVEFIANDLVSGIDETEPQFHLIAPDRDVMPRAAFDVANGLSFSDRAASLIDRIAPWFIYERYSRFSLAGVEASLRTGIPLFLEYNGSEVWVGRHWDRTERLDLLERYEKLNLEKADRIFVVSEVEKKTLIDRGIQEEKIVVNPNGVDPEVFRPRTGRENVRKQFGIPDDTIVAGFLGTFGPWHGVLELAEAIALTPKDADIHFLLIGDGSLRREVENRLRHSGDLDRVTFTGVVPHDRVPSFLDACDILISPHVPLAAGAEFFGSPTKLFEYMAMGKAIVASRLGQIGEVLTDNKTALLVEPGDTQDLSVAVQRLANESELRYRLGKAARSAAIGLHTWRANAKNVMDTFRELYVKA